MEADYSFLYWDEVFPVAMQIVWLFKRKLSPPTITNDKWSVHASEVQWIDSFDSVESVITILELFTGR